MPDWLTDLLTGDGFSSLAGLKDMPGSEDGPAALGREGLTQQDWEELGQKLADVLNARGMAGTNATAEGTSAGNVFGKILQRELFKAISADPRFAGLAAGAPRRG